MLSFLMSYFFAIFWMPFSLTAALDCVPGACWDFLLWWPKNITTGLNVLTLCSPHVHVLPPWVFVAFCSKNFICFIIMLVYLGHSLLKNHQANYIYTFFLNINGKNTRNYTIAKFYWRTPAFAADTLSLGKVMWCNLRLVSWIGLIVTTRHVAALYGFSLIFFLMLWRQN